MSDTQTFPTSDPTESVAGTMDLVNLAARRGAADASEAAARTRDAAGLFINRFVYTTCYTVSYGVVFPAILLARAVPRDNLAVRGLIEGAEAARKKVDEVYHPALAAPGAGMAALPA